MSASDAHLDSSMNASWHLDGLTEKVQQVIDSEGEDGAPVPPELVEAAISSKPTLIEPKQQEKVPSRRKSIKARAKPRRSNKSRRKLEKKRLNRNSEEFVDDDDDDDMSQFSVSSLGSSKSSESRTTAKTSHTTAHLEAAKEKQIKTDFLNDSDPDELSKELASFPFNSKMAATRSANLNTVPLEESIIPPSGVDKYGVALSSPQKQLQQQLQPHDPHQPPQDLDLDVAGEYCFSTRKPKTYNMAMNDTVMKMMGNTVEEEEEKSIHIREIFNDIIKEDPPPPTPPRENPRVFDTLKNHLSSARNSLLGAPELSPVEERIPINQNIAACENGIPAPELGTPRGSSVTNSFRRILSRRSASAASAEYLRDNADPDEVEHMRENSMQNTENSNRGADDANNGPFGVFRLWSTHDEIPYGTRGYNLLTCRRKLLIVFMAALLVAIVVLISVLVTNGNGSGSEPWEVQSEPRSVPQRPSPSTPERFTEVAQESGSEVWNNERVEELLEGVSSNYVLEDPSTPQGRAKTWILGDVGESQGMSSTRVVQRYILATLYYSTRDGAKPWFEEENWLSTDHECTWFGVMCGADGSEGFEPMDGRELPPNLGHSITYLNLNSNNLRGPLPPEIGKLENLGQLHLYDNSLTSTIPESISQLSFLHTLFLDKNFLEGEIPGGIDDIHSLVNLDLSSNSLSGAIPDLEHLTNLVYLRLDNNNLTGQFPKSLERLVSVEVLTMGNNGIEGELPVALEEHQKLKILHLHENKLQGDVPECKSPVLEEIHLDNNAFSGSIPWIVEAGRTPNLRELRLERNNLSGSIPMHLGDMWSLEKLWLDHNDLSGQIPHEIGRLENLQSLRLLQNRLTGTVPGPVCFLRNYELSTFQATCDGSNPDLECSCCTRCTY